MTVPGFHLKVGFGLAAVPLAKRSAVGLNRIRRRKSRKITRIASRTQDPVPVVAQCESARGEGGGRDAARRGSKLQVPEYQTDRYVDVGGKAVRLAW